MGIVSFKDLSVWQKAMSLVESVYQITNRLPHEELYALTNQIRRAVISVPSNIAEGNARYSSKDYVRFLCIANGSNAEVQTQLMLCARLGYIDEDEIIPVLELSYEIRSMLWALANKIEQIQ